MSEVNVLTADLLGKYLEDDSWDWDLSSYLKIDAESAKLFSETFVDESEILVLAIEDLPIETAANFQSFKGSLHLPSIKKVDADSFNQLHSVPVLMLGIQALSEDECQFLSNYEGHLMLPNISIISEEVAGAFAISKAREFTFSSLTKLSPSSAALLYSVARRLRPPRTSAIERSPRHIQNLTRLFCSHILGELFCGDHSLSPVSFGGVAIPNISETFF